MEKSIKIGLAILFLMCLLDLPYGYFQFVRFTAMVGFISLAFLSTEKYNKTFFILYSCLALLFQPFFKIALGRGLWNIVDVTVALFLLGTLLFHKKKN